MSRDSFFDVGNLADAPKLRFVNVGTEKRAVADMRVFCAKYTRDANGEIKERSDSFWMSVSLWGSKAERAAKLLTKGARVCVVGELGQQKWIDQETGELKYAFSVTASDVFLDLSRVNNIHWQESRAHAQATDATLPDMDMPPVEAYESGSIVGVSDAINTDSSADALVVTAQQPGKRNKGVKEMAQAAS